MEARESGGRPGRPLVLSASRRTDLPGYHAEICAARIRRRVERLRTRRLHGVVFWTRHPAPFIGRGPLARLVRGELDNPLVNLTVTGLGGTLIEPGVPTTGEVLAALPALVDAFHGQGFRVRWRFDPLLKGLSSFSEFQRIGEAMAAVGVERCTFSFPSYRSLKGDLTPAFERAGIAAWDREERRVFLGRLHELATGFGITLESCTQPANTRLVPGVEEASCVSRALLERGHPEHLPLALGRDWSQRKACRCIESEDIGDYARDICQGGCAYCYSKAGGPRG